MKILIMGLSTFFLTGVGFAQTILPDNFETNLLKSLAELNVEEEIKPVFLLEASETATFVGDDLVVYLKGDVERIKSVNWFLNGRGMKTFENKFILKTSETYNYLTELVITAEIFYLHDNGQFETQTVYLNRSPILLDLILNNNGVVKPFYKGRKHLLNQQPFTVSAIIRITKNGEVFTEDDFNYRWYVEESIYPKEKDLNEIIEAGFLGRGIGANTIYIPNGTSPVLSPMSVKVEIYNGQLSESRITKYIYIDAVNPKLLIYEINSTEGLNEHTVSKLFTTIKNPLSLTILPFHFSRAAFENNEISYEWYLSNDTNQIKTSKNIDIGYKGEKPVINLSTNIYHKGKEKYFQEARQNLFLSFK